MKKDDIVNPVEDNNDGGEHEGQDEEEMQEVEVRVIEEGSKPEPKPESSNGKPRPDPYRWVDRANGDRYLTDRWLRRK